MKRPGWIYFAYAPEMHRCKIGWTGNTPAQRLADKTDNPDAINIWGMLLAESDEMESQMHQHWGYLRIKGEWFAVDEALREFVQFHTYRCPEATDSYTWSDQYWAAWDRLSVDSEVQRLVCLCQVNPVELIRKWQDPLGYFYRVVKPHLLGCVGYEARWRDDPFYKSALAYDVVYEMCVDLLPC